MNATAKKLNNSKKGSSKNNVVVSRLESNIVYLVPQNRVEDAKWFIKNMYADMDNSNFIAVGTKHNKAYQQYCVTYKRLEEKLINILSLSDTYTSINSFWTVNRQEQSVRRLNACFIDIDYYKIEELKHLSAEEVVQKMRQEGLFDEIEPSFFVGSGRGLYIYYLLENCSKHCMKLFKRIQDTLVEKFEPYNADKRARDVSHVLRLPGTRHSKANEIARVIWNSDKAFRFQRMREEVRRYTISELADAFLPKLKYSKSEWEEIKKERKKQAKEKARRRQLQREKQVSITTLCTRRNLNYSRMQDLRTLQTVRGSKTTNNCREFMCYLYRLFCLHFLEGDTEKALKDTLAFNQSFADPLKEIEVIAETKSAEEAYKNYVKASKEFESLENKISWSLFAYQRKCNLYTNKTLIKELEITSEEQQMLTTIISTSVKNKRYYEKHKDEIKKNRKQRYREEAGKTKEEKIKEDRQKIRDLLHKGLKQKDIAIKLNVSLRTVKNRIKELKQEGLL
ncbi:MULTISPECIES: helix-turn-helix domain-containing protein [unclassified Bacillus cereus group]|uniref:helix-turn-helix domain-containing protein n=1 Tax=unclassified Bacillus cereus group TaxID=2750818 RepID=UPI001F55F2A2|nr:MULTISPECIES: helix-turn-helix domain-containing protein [unclassified Bacillus cereus group]